MKFILTVLAEIIVACLFVIAAAFVSYLIYLLAYLLVGASLPTIQEVVFTIFIYLGGIYCINIAAGIVDTFIDFKV